MTYTHLISTETLAAHLEDPDWLVADCRFALSKPNEKREYYLKAHIPGAIYVHLDHDLAAPIIPGVTGRHPLPTTDEAAQHFGQIGIRPGMQVVAYDDQGGSLAAVRLWWMLRWLGHDAVAVLDGGWQKWMEEDLPVRGGEETRPPAALTAQPRPGMFVTGDEVEQLRRDPAYRVFDVRAPERYRGEVEPIDPVAGHIPGAINAPYSENTRPDWTFRSPEELRAQYLALLGGLPPERAVFYCGSGVTSIQSVLALEIAGLPGARLYPGSWSEWIANRQRDVATGSEIG